MYFCFLVEAHRQNLMPLAVTRPPVAWGDNVDLQVLQTLLTCLTHLPREKHDANNLKTVLDGTGLSRLEAAEAVGLPTIYHSRSIRLVRDKAVAPAYAHRLPIPLPSFAAHPELLKQIPTEHYPLIRKPTNGSSFRGIFLRESPTDLAKLQGVKTNAHFSWINTMKRRM